MNALAFNVFINWLGAGSDMSKDIPVGQLIARPQILGHFFFIKGMGRFAIRACGASTIAIGEIWICSLTLTKINQ